MQIVRWNGGFGDFTALHSYNGEKFGVTNGDTVTATIVGNVITTYKNGVQQGQVTDSTFSSGSPGSGSISRMTRAAAPERMRTTDSAASPRWIARVSDVGRDDDAAKLGLKSHDRDRLTAR